MIKRLIWGQFRKPSGFLGRIIGNSMARSNDYAAKWTVSLLDIQPESRVLEIGFGPGVAIQYASEKASNGLVSGVELSDTMVRAASKRNALTIQAGRIELKQGDVASLSYPDESFDKAFAVQVIFFWTRPVDCLKELRRVLKPNGLLAITFRPRDKWPKGQTPPPDLGAFYDSNEVVQMFSAAGFRDVRVDICPAQDKYPGECVLGIK